MKQFLIILRGAPASGKTTIAKVLRGTNQEIAWLKIDNFKDFFVDESLEMLQYVNGLAVATLEYLLDKEFSVVMDGVFQDVQPINRSVDIAKRKGIKTLVYELECPLEELQKRDKTREGVKEGFRKPLGDRTIQEIYERLKMNPYPHARVFDTEHTTFEQIINIIRKNLEAYDKKY